MNLSEISPKRLLPEPVVVNPSIALVMPYDPKMMPKAEIEQRVRRLQAEAEKRLLAVHPAELAMPVIRNLQQLIRRLNGSTHRVSVALFATLDVAKVAYMDFPVEERLIVDEPFLIRDIADCKPSTREILVLLLSAKESRMYVNDGARMRLIKINTPQHVYSNDPEVMVNKFLHHMDLGLGAVLKMYPLPVYVIGTERVTGHFERITRYDRHIAGYIHKQGIGLTEQEMMDLLEPSLRDWQKTREQLLLRQMENAAQAGKLVCGIHDARKAAGCRNSRLIVVERTEKEDGQPAFYTDGELDPIIEKVLESGGDVEKMDGELMGSYGPVALIRYY